MFRDSPLGPDPRRSEASVVGEEDSTFDVNSALVSSSLFGVSLVYARYGSFCERLERESLMNTEVLTPLVRQLSLSRAF